MIVCTYEGCARPRRRQSASYCEGHYYQQRRGQELRPLNPRRANGETVVCAAEGCELLSLRGRWCPKHYARVARHGSPDVCIPQAERDLPRGERNHRWNPAPDYGTTHQRLRVALGRAADRTCECGSPAAQWSYVGPRKPGERLPFGDLTQYVAKCVPCHKRDDLAAIREVVPA